MFDDCKGDRFLELLASFSTLVLRKVVTASPEGAGSISRSVLSQDRYDSIEKRSMLPLAVAHRASLQAILRRRAQLKARYKEFSQVLNLKDRQVDRQFEEIVNTQDFLDQNIAPEATVARISKQFEQHWHGDRTYVDAITQGDRSTTSDALLDRPFHEMWQEVSQGTHAPDFSTSRQSLLQNLEQRVSVQHQRLQNWQALKADMQRNLSSDPTTASPVRAIELKSPNKAQEKELVFSPRKSPRKSEFPLPINTDLSPQVIRAPVSPLSESVTISESPTGISRKANDTFIKRRRSQVNTIFEDSPNSTENNDSGFSEISSQDVTTRFELKNTSPLHSVKNAHVNSTDPSKITPKDVRQVDAEGFAIPQIGNPAFRRYSYMTSAAFPVAKDDSNTNNVADVNPQPTDYPIPPPQNKPLSLSERTRQSMTLVSPSSRLLPDISSPAKPNLADRTRKSMSLVPARTKPPRKSIAGSNRRDSRNYPVNQFETPGRGGAMKELTPPNEIFSPGAGYDSVFKSRPKVGFSPTMEMELELNGENERVMAPGGEGSSPLARLEGKV